MKKKIMAVVAALAIMTVGTTAFASESPTYVGSEAEAVSGQTVETSIVGADKTKAADYAKALTVSTDIGVEFDVNAVSETSILSANRAAQNLLADVKDLGKELDNDALRDAAKDSTKKVTATVLSVVNISPKSTDYYNGKVTLNLAGVSANKTYAVLHYSDWYGWQVIAPEKVEDGKITIKTTEYSVYAIVEIGVDGATVETPANNGQTTVDAGTASTPATTPEGTSPKTGEY